MTATYRIHFMFALFYKFGLNQSEHIYIAIIHVICKESKTLEESAGCRARESPNVKLKTAVIPFAQAATGPIPAYVGPEDIVFFFQDPLHPSSPVVTINFCTLEEAFFSI